MPSRFLAKVAEWFDSLGGADFVIRVRPGRPVAVRGRLPRSKIPGIAEFFGRDLRETRAATIRGSRAGGTLRLRFSGVIGPGDRQRARNFLLDHLR